MLRLIQGEKNGFLTALSTMDVSMERIADRTVTREEWLVGISVVKPLASLYLIGDNGGPIMRTVDVHDPRFLDRGPSLE